MAESARRPPMIDLGVSEIRGHLILGVLIIRIVLFRVLY